MNTFSRIQDVFRNESETGRTLFIVFLAILGTAVFCWGMAGEEPGAPLPAQSAGDATRDLPGIEEISIDLPSLPSGARPLVLVRIPAGDFRMGSLEFEPGRRDAEGPIRTVTIEYEFFLGKWPVTQAQWIAVMGQNPSQFEGMDHPVDSVTWNQCQAFVAVLNERVPEAGFRLPSEAEWEYAYRTGTKTRFFFGDSLGCEKGCEDCEAGTLPGNRSDYMWYCGNNTPRGTKPVGLKLPNPFGLFDMHGNVWEWCEDDWFASSIYGPRDGSARVDSPRGLTRVLRGGAWSEHAQDCRSAFRVANRPDARHENTGFRLARDAR